MKKLFAFAITQDLDEKKSTRWPTAISILVLFIIGSILNIPFSRELRRLKIEAGIPDVVLSPSIWDDLPNYLISSTILGVILVFVGLWISAKTNLGAPLISRMYSNASLKGMISWKVIFQSMVLGAGAALILLALFELQKWLYPMEHILPRPDKPFYAVVAFSAGITEEIMFRLGLMSLIVVLIQTAKNHISPTNSTIWIAILLSGVFFGLIHLPLSKNFVNPAPFTIAVTMIGNLITGTIFGWIYWKRGLLVAILAHITFDLVFHVLGSPYA